MKKGSKIEITGNIPFTPKPTLETVVSVNGAYVLVKPKYQRFLENEVRLIK